MLTYWFFFGCIWQLIVGVSLCGCLFQVVSSRTYSKKKIVLGRIFFTQNSTHANLPMQMCVLGVFYCGAIWVFFNIHSPSRNSETHSESVILTKNEKTKRNMQESARFFSSLAFLVTCIFISIKWSTVPVNYRSTWPITYEPRFSVCYPNFSTSFTGKWIVVSVVQN